MTRHRSRSRPFKPWTRVFGRYLWKTFEWDDARVGSKGTVQSCYGDVCTRGRQFAGAEAAANHHQSGIMVVEELAFDEAPDCRPPYAFMTPWFGEARRARGRRGVPHRRDGHAQARRASFLQGSS
jgi:hypothetical protein